MSNEQQQSSVQWFYDKLIEHGIIVVNQTTYQVKCKHETLLEQAKEMEKEQKRKDFTDGYMHGNEPLNHNVIDKWYNETYGGNK
jgi:hypothetical protein